jgi:hypothetical protein
LLKEQTVDHINGNAFDCRFLKSDGSGSNDISNLTADEIKLNGRFVAILKESGLFTVFYTVNGKIPGSVHSADHKDHIHGNQIKKNDKKNFNPNYIVEFI